MIKHSNLWPESANADYISLVNWQMVVPSHLSQLPPMFSMSSKDSKHKVREKKRTTRTKNRSLPYEPAPTRRQINGHEADISLFSELAGTFRGYDKTGFRPAKNGYEADVSSASGSPYLLSVLGAASPFGNSPPFEASPLGV